MAFCQGHRGRMAGIPRLTPSCTTSSWLLQIFQCSCRSRGKPPPLKRRRFGKALQSYGKFPNLQNFSKLFFQKTELNVDPGRYILYRGWRGLRRKPASLSKAGAKVDTFSIPAKFFTHFFQRFFHQNRQPPDSHHPNPHAKTHPPKAPGNPSATNVHPHHYLAPLHKKNKQARQQLKTSTRK